MLKKSLSLLIAMCPTNILRIAMLRWLRGYNISWDSRIGWGTVLDACQVNLHSVTIGPANWIQCSNFKMAERSRLGRLNVIRMLNAFEVGKGSVVVSNNRFFGTRPGSSPFKADERVVIGDDSIITTHHVFDGSGGIQIGNDVTFGGTGTQVWTHGFDLNHVHIQSQISIGNRVYIGSRCMVLGGVSICGSVSIGSGAIISCSIQEPGFYVSSRLERKQDVKDFIGDERVVEHQGGRFVKK